MNATFHRTAAFLLLAGSLLGLAACAGGPTTPANTTPSEATGTAPGQTGQTGTDAGKVTPTPTPTTSNQPQNNPPADAGTGKSDKTNGSSTAKPADSSAAKGNDGKTEQVVAKPLDIAVLINKTYRLPENYRPDDLVEPDIPFIFKEKSDKRLMRKEAAGALEKLVAGAKKDGVLLAGVSAFRSESTQTTLFNNYAKQDGIEAANMYSALPGHSEHQTGLAIDLSGSNGKCAASDCFAGTKEATWIAEHADEYGFIVRYPKGKENITGYQYEPWHIRYVGEKTAKDIADKGVTLEEYMQEAIPVSK